MSAPGKRRRTARPAAIRASQIFAPQESTLLDLLDHLLNQGVVLTGDLVLGVAGVDLIFIRLNALIAAADRVLGPEATDELRRARLRERELGDP